MTTILRFLFRHYAGSGLLAHVYPTGRNWLKPDQWRFCKAASIYVSASTFKALHEAIAAAAVFPMSLHREPPQKENLH